jgi:hypothetical protein
VFKSFEAVLCKHYTSGLHLYCREREYQLCWPITYTAVLLSDEVAEGSDQKLCPAYHLCQEIYVAITWSDQERKPYQYNE